MAGKFKVVITDDQKAVRIPKGLRMLIRRSCIAALQNENIENDTQVNVDFVDNRHISKLNKEFNDSDATVSNIVIPKEGDDKCIGNIVISMEKTVEQAESQMSTLEREVGYTVVHGVLQLTGNTPKSDLEESKLKDREEYIMYLLGLPSSSAYALNNA